MRTHLLMLALLLPGAASAATFDMPLPEFDLIGAIHVVEAQHEDTLLDIARRYDIGQEQITRANPEVDRWLPGDGTKVIIPTRYILPAAPREGLVLNVPEMRLYYYPKPKPGETPVVKTFPVGIGRQDWGTPLGLTKVVGKIKDPTWTPPASIRKEHLENGDPLPAVVPAGPNNPLGAYAMRLAIGGGSYLIHGTNKAFGVGMRASHGCIRMMPEDIEYLFGHIAVGTPVRIVSETAKVGWFGGKLYLEIHEPLEEDKVGHEQLLGNALRLIDAAQASRLVELDEDAISRALTERTGMPVPISKDV
ncbi:MAG: L,D-transpeptidase family protein [Gammaproteobacteria bacterium]|nr:L,D-transpeptidase family protein [Gammaproteobacteria bacterium]MDH5171487.1 L,D-transpeptidase family protein [Gammaproteobacteria bacterium]